MIEDVAIKRTQRLNASIQMLVRVTSQRFMWFMDAILMLDLLIQPSILSIVTLMRFILVFTKYVSAMDFEIVGRRRIHESRRCDANEIHDSSLAYIFILRLSSWIGNSLSYTSINGFFSGWILGEHRNDEYLHWKRMDYVACIPPCCRVGDYGRVCYISCVLVDRSSIHFGIHMSNELKRRFNKTESHFISQNDVCRSK